MRPTILGVGLLIGAMSGTAWADYRPHSPYLRQPSNNIDIVVNIADFWAKARDDVNGGYYSYVDDRGAPMRPFPDCAALDYDPKSVVGQSRVAYAFVRAFQLTGNESYLEAARHALSFLYAKGWDAATGGWWFSTDQAGTPKPWFPCIGWDPNTYKWTYAQIYPLVGIGAMLEATRGKVIGDAAPPIPGSDWDWYLKGLALLNERLWDGRPEYAGYYEKTDLDWSNPVGKGFTGTVDGITTHAAAAARLLDDAGALQRFLELANIAMGRLVAQIDNPLVKFGFPPSYDADWNIDFGTTSDDIGHVLKTSWALGRAYLAASNPEWQAGSTKVLRDVLDKGGYDFEHGGPYRSADWTTGAITQGKDYWMLEQAVNAGLVNHRIAQSESDRDDGLRIADQSLDFFVNHLMDWTDGGYYAQTDNEGTVTNAAKGDIFEQGYHGSELGYFAYLYGHAFLTHRPFNLYYELEAAATPRVVRLEPAELGEGAIRITNVLQDGRRFRGTFCGLTLYLPAGVGGKLRVTFTPAR